MAVALYRFKSDFLRSVNGSLVQSGDDMVYLYCSICWKSQIQKEVSLNSLTTPFRRLLRARLD